MRKIAAVVTTLALLGMPASANPPEDRARATFEQYRRAVESMFIAGDPEARRFFETVQLAEDPFVVFWHRPIHDMNHDAAGEVLVERWRFTFDPVGFGLTGDYRAQVLDGRSGSLSWTYRNEFHGGFPVLAMPIKLGEGVPGLLFPKIDNQSAESPTYRLSFDALDAEGQRVWQREFTSTYNLATGDTVGTDLPLTFQRFDADGDETTDFLVATTDYVRSEVPERAVAISEVSVLDASDGSMASKGTVGPDVRWFHSIQAGPDIDGGGGQDIVIAGEADTTTNEELASSYVEARSGRTLETLWRRETPLRWNAWAGGVPDMTGDGARDLVVGWDDPDSGERFFQVWDASVGRPLWKYRGTFPHLLGDVDGDGLTDLGAYRFVHAETRAGARFLAFSRGRTLYTKSYVREPPDCGGFCFSFGFYLDAGDINGDSVRDTYVRVSYPSDKKPIVDEYAVSGGTGELLYRERRLGPILGTIDGDGDDLIGFHRIREGALRATAVDGTTRRTLWSGIYEMAGAKNLGPFGAYDSIAELDGDEDPELLLTIEGKKVATLLAIEGETGRILWQRPITGRERVTSGVE